MRYSAARCVRAGSERTVEYPRLLPARIHHGRVVLVDNNIVCVRHHRGGNVHLGTFHVLPVGYTKNPVKRIKQVRGQ